jgi:hypothetical protein
VEYKPVNLPQAYRDFSSENPWEGESTQEASKVLNENINIKK